MRDYIVSPRCITSRIASANQADATASPALSLAEKDNRIGITKVSETYNDYTSFSCDYFHKFKKIRIKPGARCAAGILENGECDIIISRSHCNIECYRASQKRGGVTC